MFIWITNKFGNDEPTLHVSNSRAYFDSHLHVRALMISGLEPIAEITAQQSTSMEFVQFIEAGRKAGLHICFCEES